MRPMRAGLAAALLTAAAVGCERGSSAPWLTYPGVDGHARYLKLAGTPHDPSAAGATAGCEGCHPGATFTQFECTGCHTEAQCAGIHQGAVAGYAWASPSCYRCHPDGLGVVADHDTRFFPIGTASHPAVCTSCHTSLADRTPATLACASCHLARAGFAGKHAAVADYPAAPSGADCVRCHADDQVTRVADHAATSAGAPPVTYFPVSSGSATHTTTCLQCHTRLRTDKPWAVDFAAFECVTCHAHADQAAVTTAHTGVTGFAYQSADCFRCHPDGTGAPANHTPSFFPIGAGTRHAGVACRQCHTDLTRPNDPANFACASCHLASVTDPSFAAKHTSPASGVAILTVHTSESGTSAPLSLTSVNCLRCHADGQVDLVSAHPTDERGFGKGEHRSAGCVTCHSTYRTDKPFGADFGATSGCVTCHPRGIPN